MNAIDLLITKHAPCVAVLFGLCLFSGCAKPQENTLQGYVEGEFVFVASPLAGTLETLFVQSGALVQSNDVLFQLETDVEVTARELTSRRLEEGRAYLEDAKKGKRQPEIDAIEARLKQNRASLVYTEKEFVRQTQLFESDSSAVHDLDLARAARDQDQQRVSTLEAELKIAQLGSRSDLITAAEANVRALEAALAKADWDLGQKRRNAPQAGIVFDTLFHVGEWVAAGRPVVVMLPPENIKVRMFVPEERVGTIHLGDRLQVHVDGVAESFPGTISFISPQAEYTPPVIYSQENRSKLVFMVEAVFEPAIAAKLHPGQPVEIHFEP